MAGSRHTDPGENPGRGRRARRDASSPAHGDWSEVLGDPKGRDRSPGADGASDRRHPTAPVEAHPPSDTYPDLPQDPVLAAMAELETETLDVPAQPRVAYSPTGAPPGSDGRPPSAGRPRRGAPARPKAPVPVGYSDQAATVVGPEPAPPAAKTPPPRLVLPRPKGAAGPAPQAAPEPAPMAAVFNDPHDDDAFSTEGLVDRLHAEETPAAPKDGANAYRELAITLAVVAVGVIATIVYQLTRPRAEPDAAPVPVVIDGPSPRPTPTDVPTPANDRSAAPSTNRPTRPQNTDGQTSPAAIPMLSIVSTPSGAIVDIDGVVYGRTPLIMPSPRNESALSVTLKKPGHKTHTEVLTRNEGGHFSLNVSLQPN